jgi:hypothetical protein
MPWRVERDNLYLIRDVKGKTVLEAVFEAQALELVQAAKDIAALHERLDAEIEQTFGVGVAPARAASLGSAEELFDERLPVVLTRYEGKAKAHEINARYCFSIAGVGVWSVDCTAPQPTVVLGNDGRAQCTITVDHADFKRWLVDPNAGMQLYFQGKLGVSGDPMLVMKVQSLFDLARG